MLPGGPHQWSVSEQSMEPSPRLRNTRCHHDWIYSEFNDITSTQGTYTPSQTKSIGKMKFLKRRSNQADKQSSEASLDYEAAPGHTLDTKIPYVTWRSFALGAFASIGGIIFGYDTGQISGFLEMSNFLARYGQQDEHGAYYFSNVRSGLIVGMVCIPCIPSFSDI